MVTIIFAFSLSTSAVAADSVEDELIISGEVLSNSVIKIENDSLITVTMATTSALPATRSSGENVYSCDVDVIALLISEPLNVDDVYQELLAAEDDAASYKTLSNAIVGLTLHSTVYYTTQSADGWDWYRLISVEGGNNKNNDSNVIGSGYVISRQFVRYGWQGKNLEGLVAEGEQIDENLSTSANSFNIEVNDFPAVGEFHGIVGATYTVVVSSRRGGDDIWLELTNNPLDTVGYPGN